MKIFHYCANPGGFMYEWHHFHMIAELQHAGHEVHYCNPYAVLGRNANAADCADVAFTEVERMLKIGKIDLFFATAKDTTMEAHAVEQVRAKGIPAVNLSMDDLAVPFRIKKIASSFDLIWTTSYENEALLRSYGARTLVMPYAANPFVFRPAIDRHERRTIGFIGSCYGARAKYTASLAERGVSVSIYGSATSNSTLTSVRTTPLSRALARGVPALVHACNSIRFHAGRKCVYAALMRSISRLEASYLRQLRSSSCVTFLPGPSFDEMGSVYGDVALSLGSMEVGSTYVLRQPVLFIRLREFEAAMCGAVHITNRHPELQDYFEEDQEMLYYSSTDELLDKVAFYLDPKRDLLREHIRRNARSRAQREHTWLHRFQRMFQTLGLRTPDLLSENMHTS